MTRDAVIRAAESYADGPHLEGYYGARRDAFLAALAAHERAIRVQALEDAARVCDEKHYGWRWDDEPDSDSGPRDCATAIRALAQKEDSHE